MNKYKYNILNLDCANCAKKIEDQLNQSVNFQNVIVNFSTSKLIYESNIDEHETEALKMIQRIEPDVTIEKDSVKMDFNMKKSSLLLLTGGLMIGLFSLLFDGTISNVFILISYVLLLTKVFIKAIKILIKNHSLDENMLITISVIGAFLIGEAFEGFMVIALYSIGKLLEEMAVNKSRKNVSQLMDIKADYANVIENGRITQKDPNEVHIDDVIVVKVGEKIPLDGMITKGNTHLNYTALTGEAIPITKKENDFVLSGSINLTEVIEVKVTSQYENSTVNQILNLVENATNRKAKTENFVSKAAKIYTPIIISLSLLTWLILPLFGVANNDAIYRALSFLVISCPCAIAISVPLSYFSGIGISSKHGILIKGSDYLDNLRNIKTLVFDKTGTLTTGEFTVTSVASFNKKISKEEILKLCAYGESFSNHPIASAIIKSYNQVINQSEINDYQELAGKGITFTYHNEKYKLGNHNFVNYQDKNTDATCIYLVKNKNVIGKITLDDQLKENTNKAIRSLQKQGIKTIMLTGDKKEVAEKIAKQCNISKYYAELLPQDKYHLVEKELAKQNGTLAFVGDGINDAPVLTLADIGISMGLIGSSSAIEASDVVIMTDEINKIDEGIRISKYTAKIIKQNLLFSIGTKLLFILLNFFGYSTMFLAVFADVGVTILAILNSLRILYFKK